MTPATMDPKVERLRETEKRRQVERHASRVLLMRADLTTQAVRREAGELLGLLHGSAMQDEVAGIEARVEEGVRRKKPRTKP